MMYPEEPVGDLIAFSWDGRGEKTTCLGGG